MPADPTLDKIIGSLVAAETAISAGILKGNRPWVDFQEISPVDKFDYSGLHSLFSRESLETAYAKLVSSPDATSKEVQTAKLSVDVLAGIERDWRMRQRSRVRLLVHACARAKVYGNKAGPLMQHSVGWMSRILVDDKAAT
jgi:hypothetical protein